MQTYTVKSDTRNLSPATATTASTVFAAFKCACFVGQPCALSLSLGGPRVCGYPTNILHMHHAQTQRSRLHAMTTCVRILRCSTCKKNSTSGKRRRRRRLLCCLPGSDVYYNVQYSYDTMVVAGCCHSCATAAAAATRKPYIIMVS